MAFRLLPEPSQVRASHKYLPGGRHCQPLGHLQTMASAHSTGLQAHSYANTWLSKRVDL
jgi:hypothetical protein